MNALGARLLAGPKAGHCDSASHLSADRPAEPRPDRDGDSAFEPPRRYSADGTTKESMTN